MRTTLLKQISTRREQLGIRTSDMPLVAGINRQQYEKIEKGGNPSLSTLDKIAEGLDAELLLVPKDKLREIQLFLAGSTALKPTTSDNTTANNPDEVADPWAEILGDDL